MVETVSALFFSLMLQHTGEAVEYLDFVQTKTQLIEHDLMFIIDFNPKLDKSVLSRLGPFFVRGVEDLRILLSPCSLGRVGDRDVPVTSATFR